MTRDELYKRQYTSALKILNENSIQEDLSDVADYAQLGASVVSAGLSFIPGLNLVGSAIDLANSGVYLARGQKENAAWSAGAAAIGLIPMGGALSKIAQAGKFASKVSGTKAVAGLGVKVGTKLIKQIPGGVKVLDKTQKASKAVVNLPTKAAEIAAKNPILAKIMDTTNRYNAKAEVVANAIGRNKFAQLGAAGTVLYAADQYLNPNSETQTATAGALALAIATRGKVKPVLQIAKSTRGLGQSARLARIANAANAIRDTARTTAKVALPSRRSIPIGKRNSRFRIPPAQNASLKFPQPTASAQRVPLEIPATPHTSPLKLTPEIPATPHTAPFKFPTEIPATPSPHALPRLAKETALRTAPRIAPYTNVNLAPRAKPLPAKKPPIRPIIRRIPKLPKIPVYNQGQLDRGIVDRFKLGMWTPGFGGEVKARYSSFNKNKRGVVQFQAEGKTPEELEQEEREELDAANNRADAALDVTLTRPDTFEPIKLPTSDPRLSALVRRTVHNIQTMNYFRPQGVGSAPGGRTVYESTEEDNTPHNPLYGTVRSHVERYLRSRIGQPLNLHLKSISKNLT